MHWNDLRNHWQFHPLTPGGEESDMRAILHRARKRERNIKLRIIIRDALETVVAILIAPAMAFLAWKALSNGVWVAGISAALLALWAIFVPVRLWQARRRRVEENPDQPVVDFLYAERGMCERQAKMLEAVLIWYLGPAWIGCVGVYAGLRGHHISTYMYVMAITALYALIYVGNRVAAKTVFRKRINEIDEELSALRNSENSVSQL